MVSEREILGHVFESKMVSNDVFSLRRSDSRTDHRAPKRRRRDSSPPTPPSVPQPRSPSPNSLLKSRSIQTKLKLSETSFFAELIKEKRMRELAMKKLEERANPEVILLIK